MLKRQQNERISSISGSAVEDIQEAVDKCDEIIYEVARAVLVAHERMGSVSSIDGMFVVSIKERAQWPLFQMRLYTLIAELSTAKMDVVLHLLVLQVRSERFYGRKMDTALFSSLNRQEREVVIAHLWHGKTLRNPDHQVSSLAIPFHGRARSTPDDNSAVLQRLAEEVNQGESDSSDAETSSTCSERRGRSVFQRIARRISRSSSRFFSRSPSPVRRHQEGSRTRPPRASRANSGASSLARSHSSSTRSTSDLSSNSSAARSYSSSSSTGTAFSQLSDLAIQKKFSLLSITNPVQVQTDVVSKGLKRVSWQHGPTMSAKRGIELEWEAIKSQGEEWEEGNGSEERRLGHQLLLSQLTAKATIQNRDALPPTVTVDMLVSRWTTVPRRDPFVGVMQNASGTPQTQTKFTFASGNDGRPAHSRRAETMPNRRQSPPAGPAMSRQMTA